MKVLWMVLLALSLLCGVASAWLLLTSGAGARMLAAAQLFVAGALASLGCAGVAAVLEDHRNQRLGLVLVAAYALALGAFLLSMGNVR
ncbi:hypothetical protein [Stenotrophomonas sp.]|uniref:hypothetical protein n=1 Tax=Stenotrophomonas sp. TaxID=69392 RepID=UPI0028A7FC2E|nr:hypothetical protein [Stenotrophomonas sp.]